MIDSPESKQLAEQMARLAAKGYDAKKILEAVGIQPTVIEKPKPKRRKVRKITITIWTESDVKSAAYEARGIMEDKGEYFIDWDYKVTQVFYED